VGLTLWKWVSLKMAGHTLISSDERASVRESVEKRVSLAFLILSFKAISTSDFILSYQRFT